MTRAPNQPNRLPRLLPAPPDLERSSSAVQQKRRKVSAACYECRTHRRKVLESACTAAPVLANLPPVYRGAAHMSLVRVSLTVMLLRRDREERGDEAFFPG